MVQGGAIRTRETWRCSVSESKPLDVYVFWENYPVALADDDKWRTFAEDYAKAYAAAETESLRREMAQWKTWGVVEIAVRNPQVAEYCAHWEKRVEAAERKLCAVRKELGTHKAMYWPPQNDHDTRLYEIRNGRTREYVEEHVNALFEQRESALREALKIAEVALVNSIPVEPCEGDGPLVAIRKALEGNGRKS